MTVSGCYTKFQSLRATTTPILADKDRFVTLGGRHVATDRLGAK